MRQMTLLDCASLLCRDLPVGWQAALRMEQGSGGFELYDPDGREIPFEEFASVDNRLEGQARAALRYAQRSAPKRCPGCKTTKPRNDFYVSRITADWLMRTCKVCHLASVRANRQKRRRA